MVLCCCGTYGIWRKYIRNNDFLNLKIEGDSKIVIDCYDKRTSVPCSIKILIEDIWKLSRDLNIYSCHHVYREANRTVDCRVKKGISIIDSKTWLSNFLKDIINISFKKYYGWPSNRFCKFTTL